MKPKHRKFAPRPNPMQIRITAQNNAPSSPTCLSHFSSKTPLSEPATTQCPSQVKWGDLLSEMELPRLLEDCGSACCGLSFRLSGGTSGDESVVAVRDVQGLPTSGEENEPLDDVCVGGGRPVALVNRSSSVLESGSEKLWSRALRRRRIAERDTFAATGVSRSGGWNSRKVEGFMMNFRWEDL